MLDFKDILNSWIVSFNPSTEAQNRANDRLLVCRGCDNYKEILKNKKWSAICEGCGCPIDKKVFSNKINACPLNKWAEVDKKHNTYIKVKDKKTLL